LQDVSRRFRNNALKAAGTLSCFYLHGHSSSALTAEYLNAWQTALESASLSFLHTQYALPGKVPTMSLLTKCVLRNKCFPSASVTRSSGLMAHIFR
jgi:hypothetical protein